MIKHRDENRPTGSHILMGGLVVVLMYAGSYLVFRKFWSLPVIDSTFGGMELLPSKVILIDTKLKWHLMSFYAPAYFIDHQLSGVTRHDLIY